MRLTDSSFADGLAPLIGEALGKGAYSQLLLQKVLWAHSCSFATLFEKHVVLRCKPNTGTARW